MGKGTKMVQFSGNKTEVMISFYLYVILICYNCVRVCVCASVREYVCCACVCASVYASVCVCVWLCIV